MAELSAETQAIIQRLKDEGSLTRNSGTNSIRSVKIQLDRFENVFNTISMNIAEQTNILRQQAGFAAEALEVQKSKEQFEELQVEKEKFDREESSSSETNKKIENIGDSISSALSLKNIALAGAGLFVGYNLLKGFINEQTNGGWSAMEESIANINWTSFSDAINTASASILSFSEWMDGLPALLIGGGIAGVGIRSAARGVADSLLGGAGGGRRGGALRGLTSIRTGILGAVTGLAIAYGDDVEAWLENEMGADPDVASTTVDIAQYALSGASLGSMFGPKGAIIGAAAGTAIGVGAALWDWFKDNQEEAEAEARRRLDAVKAMYPDANVEGPGSAAVLSPNAPVAAGTGEITAEAERRGLTTPDQLAAAAAGDSAARAAVEAAYQQVAEEMSTERLGGIREAISTQMQVIGNTLGGDMSDAAKNVIIENMRTLYAPDNPMLMSTYTEMLNFFKDNVLQGVNPSDPMWAEIGSEYQELYNTLTNASFRSGTQGFQDFGDGTFSILHGREAVVPYNTAAGRFLDQYFTENWEPRIANAQRLQTAAQGSAPPVVVINAPTTVSPVVNNVSGGKSVNQVSIRGGSGSGGGLFGSSNPYGLPLMAN